ncbi:MAG: hypothetical protein SH868_02620 [Bythopirellula sp.]|nr:hypothetical protein [Bythopirellula sp.]
MTNSINDNAEISAVEVAQLLRDVIEGKHSIQLADDDLPWSTEGGNIPFSVDGWKVVFHNSLFVMNYVDSATASDGRHADFDDWPENPQSLLTWTEIALLEQIIEEQGRYPLRALMDKPATLNHSPLSNT